MILLHSLLTLQTVKSLPPAGTYPISSGRVVEPSNFTWPTTGVMAPFLSLKKFPAFDIKGCMQNTSVKTFILSSINDNSDGVSTWHGTDHLNDTFYSESINQIRKAGGDVAISFGGGSGHEFSTDNFVVLASKYQNVIDMYQLKFIDIDIQSNMSETLLSINSRVKAFNLVRANNPELRISLSFLADSSGLDPHSKAVLNSCKNVGFTPDLVNLLTMDFVIEQSDSNMGDRIIAALENGQKAVKKLTPRSKMGMTFMIGKNDLNNEIFQLSDAEKVLKWAKRADYLSLISFWSINRDNGNIDAPLFASSQIEQTEFQFANILKPWARNGPILKPKKEHKAVATPSKIFAPQVDILTWPTFDIVEAATVTNNLWYNLLYVNSDGMGNTTWGGDLKIEELFYLPFIAKLRDLGGDIILTFGGPEGISLASDSHAPDAQSLAAKFEDVIDLYEPSVINFHFGNAELNDLPSITKRNAALAIVRMSNPLLKIIFSLPADQNGLSQDSIALLNSTISDGLEIDIVNILPGNLDLIVANLEAIEGGLFKSIVSSANEAYTQIQKLGLTKTTLGITPSIGISERIFSTEDAKNLVNWAKEQSHITYLSISSANKDKTNPAAVEEADDFEFTRIFSEWLYPNQSTADPTISLPLNVTSTLISTPTPDFSSLPLPFLPDLTFSAGYRWASKIFAPFVNTLDQFDLLKLSSSVGSARYILSFINLSDDGKTAVWGSKLPVKNLNWLDTIQSIRLFGGDVIFSFNGPNGNDLANGYSTLKSLTIAYQNIIDAYNIGWIDFYVDDNGSFNETVADLRNEALRNLQSSNPNLRISYSVPAGLEGLKVVSVKNLMSARAHGVRVDVVNFLAWNFVGDLNMTSDAVIQATTASIKQLPNVGYPDAKVGVVALIGENPLNVLESFNTTDAAVLTKWAKQHPSVQVLSFVDANSDTNSEFAKKFVQFEN